LESQIIELFGSLNTFSGSGVLHVVYEKLQMKQL